MQLWRGKIRTIKYTYHCNWTPVSSIEGRGVSWDINWEAFSIFVTLKAMSLMPLLGPPCPDSGRSALLILPMVLNLWRHPLLIIQSLQKMPLGIVESCCNSLRTFYLCSFEMWKFHWVCNGRPTSSTDLVIFCNHSSLNCLMIFQSLSIHWIL
jgi:hypothetical protein